MDDAASTVALPQTALQQRDGEAGDRLDSCVCADQARNFVGPATGAAAELGAVSAGVRNPFRAGTPVGAQQADTDPVHVKAWAHSLVDHFEAEADPWAVEEIPEEFSQASHVFCEGVAPRAGGQVDEVRAFIRSQTATQATAKVQPVCPKIAGDGLIDGALPDSELHVRLENVDECGGAARDDSVRYGSEEIGACIHGKGLCGWSVENGHASRDEGDAGGHETGVPDKIAFLVA